MFLTKFALWWSHCKQHRSDTRPFPKAIFQGGHSFFIDTSKPTQFKQFPKRQKLLFKSFDLGLILNLLQLKYLLHVFLINYVIFKKWKSSFQHHHLKWKNCKSSNRKLGNICSVCNSSSVQQFFSLAQMYLGLLAGETIVAILLCPWSQASYGYKWLYYLIMKRQDLE